MRHYGYVPPDSDLIALDAAASLCGLSYDGLASLVNDGCEAAGMEPTLYSAIVEGVEMVAIADVLAFVGFAPTADPIPTTDNEPFHPPHECERAQEGGPPGLFE